MRVRVCVALSVGALPGCGMEYLVPADSSPWYGVSQQPHLPPEVVSDEWRPAPRDSRLDVLLVLDNSGSMEQYHGGLVENARRLTDPLLLYGIDARVVVTTTTCGVDGASWWGCLSPEWVDASPTLADDLEEVVDFLWGYRSAIEAGMLAISHSLHPPEPWSRPEVPLLVLLATDEPDHSPPGWGLEEASAALEREEIRRRPVLPGSVPQLSGRQLLRWVTFSAVVPSPACSSAQDTSEYSDLALLWGGETYDLCSEDWADVAYRALGMDEEDAAVTVFLSRIPVLDSVVVHATYGGVEYTYERGEGDLWWYDRDDNAITVDIRLPDAARIEYEASAWRDARGGR